MLNNSRIYEIVVKTTKGSYASVNRKVIVEGTKKIGSSISGVGAMLANGDEMKALMPTLIGISSNSPNWDSLLARYWHSLSEDVDAGGRQLETGFVYDITNTKVSEYVASLNKSKKIDLKSDEDLKGFILTSHATIEDTYQIEVLEANKLSPRDREKAIKTAYDLKYRKFIELESTHYKFGEPINTAEYILWRYCLVYGDVANEFASSDKSVKIRFYLTSEDAKRELKKRKFNAERQRMVAYTKVVTEKGMAEDVLFVLGKGDEVVDGLREGWDDVDIQLLLDEESKKSSSKFIAACNDPKLGIKSMIEKYVTYDIFKRLPNTSVIVDATDSELIIGNDLDAALTFFSDEENKGVVSEFKTRFTTLTKNKK